MNKSKLTAAALAALSVSVAAPAAPAWADLGEDRFEGFNRAMFAFNDKLDEYLLLPLAEGYRLATPKELRAGVHNFYENVKEPASAVYHLLRGEPKEALTSLGRFAGNTTVGWLGFFDPATHWGLEKSYTNADQTMAKWCVPDGDYLVLPFVGSGTPRSFTGKVVDSFADPVYWATLNREDGFYASVAYTAVEYISWREGMIEISEGLRQSSVDYYAAMRAAFLQNRAKYNACGVPSGQASYDFDFNMD